MKTIEILDLPEDARELVRECEVKGARTTFARNGRPVAELISYDEYIALTETIAIANDPDFATMMNTAADELTEGHHLARWERVRLPLVLYGLSNGMADHEQAMINEVLQIIDDDPIAGAPLFDPLKGVWCYRKEHLRIAYRIDAEARTIGILGIARVAL